MDTLTRTIKQHINHHIDCYLTPQHPDKMARMDCVTCAANGRRKFLMWLSAEQAYQVGLFPNRSQALDAHESQRRRVKKLKTQALQGKKNWSTTSQKERTFYRSYQPATDFGRSQLMGDRMLYGTKYVGCPLGSIPIPYLRLCLKNSAFTDDDKAYISKHIAARTGTYPGALERSNEQRTA